MGGVVHLRAGVSCGTGGLAGRHVGDKVIAYLLNSQDTGGTWEEEWFTGTGFPRVFYLRYHYYCHYFPLWALAQYHEFTTGEKADAPTASRTEDSRFANLEV